MGGTDGRTDGRKDGRLEIPPCVLQDIGPLGPLPKKQRTNEPPPRKHFTPRTTLMSRYGQNAIIIHQSGGVLLLLPLIGEDDEEIQEAAAGCINNIRKIALANDMQKTRKI